MAFKKEMKQASGYSQTTESSELLQIPIEELFSLLRTSSSGLNSQEMEERYKAYGYNEIEQRKKKLHFWSFFLILKVLWY